MTNYLRTQGTILRLTVHNILAQNGVAERIHQTIMNLVCVNLHTASLPNKLWWYAALYAVYLYNCTPRSSLQYKTPYFKQYGTNANLDGPQHFS